MSVSAARCTKPRAASAAGCSPTPATGTRIRSPSGAASSSTRPYDGPEAGQALRLTPGQPARRPAAAVRRHLPFLRRYYPKSQADRDFLVVADSIAADAEAAGFPTTFDSNTAAGRALDRMSVYDYIERRIPGGHRSPLGALLDVAYVIEYGADSTEQSALNLIFLLGFQPNAQLAVGLWRVGREVPHPRRQSAVARSHRPLPWRRRRQDGPPPDEGHGNRRTVDTRVTFERLAARVT